MDFFLCHFSILSKNPFALLYSRINKGIKLKLRLIIATIHVPLYSAHFVDAATGSASLFAIYQEVSLPLFVAHPIQIHWVLGVHLMRTTTARPWHNAFGDLANLLI